jgi:hypothetical protein
MRSVSGAPPCGRKESRDDRRRIGRCGGRDRRGGCGCAAVAKSENQATQPERLGRRDYKTGVAESDLGPRGPAKGLYQYSLNATTAEGDPGTKVSTEDHRYVSTSSCKQLDLCFPAAFADINISKSRSVDAK